MQPIDLNLLLALNILLETESVTDAAKIMHLSPPAMSRTLSRIRKVIGDPLLVRSGRRLVPTNYAIALRPKVQAILEELNTLFQMERRVDIANIEKTFSIKISDITFGAFETRLVTKLRQEAPNIKIVCLPDERAALTDFRQGVIDLEIGELTEYGPDIRVHQLYSEKEVGLVRANHPLYKKKKVSLEEFLKYPHVLVSKEGIENKPIDHALAKVGMKRNVNLSLPSYFTALYAVTVSDTIIAAPCSLAEVFKKSFGVHSFSIPIETPPVTVSMAWHQRNDYDPIHIWLRKCVQSSFIV